MRAIKISILIILTLVIVKIDAQVDTTYRFTLLEAQDYAINNFFMSKNAALDIKAAQKRILETTAMGLPQLSGKVDYSYIPDIPEVNFPQTIMGANKADNDPIVGGDFRDPAFYSTVPGRSVQMGVTNNITYSVMLTQLIFSGEYIVGLQASRTYKLLLEENYDKVKIDIKENISSSYYAILILKENKVVLEETLDNLRLNYEHTKKFYEQGLVEDTDVDQLNLTVKRTENSLRNIENQIKYLTKLFKYQVGIKVDVNIEFVDSINQLLEKNIIEPTSYKFNLEEQVDYKLLTTKEDLQHMNFNREKTAFLPTISGFYQYRDQFKTPDFNTNIKHIVGISMSVPILSGGMRMAKVGQAKIEFDKASNMKEQEAIRLTLKSQQSMFDYNTALANYYNERENINLSKKVLDKATIKFKEGMVSSLELSIFNNQYLQAQLSYAKAIQDLLVKKVALDKAFNKL
jgi:outer membrane protein TolC